MKIKKLAAVFIFITIATLIPVVSAFPADKIAADAQEKESPKTEKTVPLKGSWLPVPVILTEPAFGYGIALGLGYIHPQKNAGGSGLGKSVETGSSVISGRSGRKPPPSVTGIAAGYTENETKFAGVGHSASWRQDTIRYLGALAYADVYSTYYVLDLPLNFNIEGAALYQDLKFRLGSSHFFLGGMLQYLKTESLFEIENSEDVPVDLGDMDSTNVGLAVDGSYDTRDNTFTPNQGQLFQLSLWRHDEFFGGDYQYWNSKLKLLSFHQPHRSFVLGLRLEISAVSGDAPFYGYPWITLRGIPAMRYQGEKVGVVEAEGRWNIFERWAILGFFGGGKVGGDDPTFETEDNILAGGVGGRYLFLKDQNLWLGVDVARGPEDMYWYIIIGQAW